MSPKNKPTPSTQDVTTTGRTGEASLQKPVGVHPPVEPTLRPVNPDAHGADNPEETTASKLEEEAETGRENRY